VLEQQLGLSGSGLDAHDRGLPLVYGAALAGWSYLVAWGLLRVVDLDQARGIGLAIGGVVGVLVVVQAMHPR
jgi:hypothetical protein